MVAAQRMLVVRVSVSLSLPVCLALYIHLNPRDSMGEPEAERNGRTDGATSGEGDGEYSLLPAPEPALASVSDIGALLLPMERRKGRNGANGEGDVKWAWREGEGETEKATTEENKWHSSADGRGWRRGADRRRKIGMFGCLNARVLPQHSSFPPFSSLRLRVFNPRLSRYTPGVHRFPISPGTVVVIRYT